ncbi:MAG: hypothetical protein FJ086_10620 [Deltaproteobacteria bacterium]|nr:hypothetical protein [Deltaproteobacteria bacterium]
MSSHAPLSRLGLLGLMSAALLLGCPSKPVPDAGVEVDAGAPDAGPVDAGFFCTYDDDCAVLAKADPALGGLRCDNDAMLEGSLADGGLPSYQCIPATPCDSDGQCMGSFPPAGVDPFNWYCNREGGCRCVTEAVQDAGTAGICRRVNTTCEPCADESECRGPEAPGGVCRVLQGDPTGQKYCFKVQDGPTCGFGLVNDAAGACVPQSGSCDQLGCQKDADCPGGSVCNLSTGLCEQRCSWNFDPNIRDTVPSCGPSKSCWVDADAVAADSSYFGAGRCRPPCTADAECAYGGTFPDGRQKLKCGSEQGKGGASLKRCRPNGPCMDSRECPETSVDSLNKGYCDRATFTCQDDCRMGLDPVTGANFGDCKPGNKCVERNGARACERQSCVELGGARIACPASHYCNNEDRNGDGAQDPAPVGALVDAIGCYRAPNPPFCFACESNADCQAAEFSVGSPLPNLCVTAGPNGAGEAQSICGIATYNDPRADDGGVPREQRMCPSNWYAQAIPVDVVDGANRCNSNADCSLGNDGGICDYDNSLRITDDQGKVRNCTNDTDCSATGEFKCNNPALQFDAGTCVGKTCMCNAPNGTECPNNPDAGITSVCRYRVGGLSQCVSSVVCLPGQSYIAKPVAQGGCGL